ncbi:MAG: hypothetical protein RLZZ450_916 [Pseudomonadota bacterium]
MVCLLQSRLRMKARQRTFRSSSITVFAAFVGVGACDLQESDPCEQVSCNPEFPSDDEPSDEEEDAGRPRADAGMDAGKDGGPETRRDASTDAGTACPKERPTVGADCSYAEICVYQWCAFDGHPTVESLCENKKTKIRMTSCNPPFDVDGGPPAIDAGPNASSDGSIDRATDARVDGPDGS